VATETDGTAAAITVSATEIGANTSAIAIIIAIAFQTLVRLARAVMAVG
jgi:hypothetical protein